MSFHLKLDRDATFENHNPNIARPMPGHVQQVTTVEVTEPKIDWVSVGLMVALGLLIGCGLALAMLQLNLPVM